MKTQLIFICTLLLCIHSQAAKFRVNNELAPSGNLHASFATAHASASNGDTIYMEGTISNYGTLTLTKRLIVIGPGYEQGYNPNTLPGGKNAYADQIVFNSGSAFSLVMGMYVGSMVIAENNITVMRNFISYNGAQNWCINFPSNTTYLNPIIIQNLFVQYHDYHVFGMGHTGTAISNMIFQSNIVYQTGAGTGDIFERNHSNVTSALIENNTFKISKFTSLGISTVIRNNIIQFINGNATAPFATTLSHNYLNFPNWPGCVSCSTSVNMSNGFHNTNAISTDGIFQLVAGTAAKTASSTGGEIGAFGGAIPYVLCGLPTVPSIYEITMPGVGTSASGINVTIKAKRNP